MRKFRGINDKKSPYPVYRKFLIFTPPPETSSRTCMIVYAVVSVKYLKRNNNRATFREILIFREKYKT